MHGKRAGEGKEGGRGEGEKSSSKSGPATRVRGEEGEVARRKSRPDYVFQTGFGVSKLEGAAKPVRSFCKSKLNDAVQES